MKKPTVSIAVPVLNEVANVKPLYESLKVARSKIDYDWECIFIDDAARTASTRPWNDFIPPQRRRRSPRS